MLTLNLIKYSDAVAIEVGEYYAVGYIPLEVTAKTPAEARAIMAKTYSNIKEEYGFILRFGQVFSWLLPDGQEIEPPNGFWDNHKKFNDDHPEFGFFDDYSQPPKIYRRKDSGKTQLYTTPLYSVESITTHTKAYQKMKTKNAKKFGFVYKQLKEGGK